MMSDDMTLVREYAQSNSEQAFATLVSQHINLVYSVALRQVHDPHLAEEITQAVFIVLARKAKSLSPKTILSGWLCRTARNVSANTLKIQRRRQLREQESHMQSILNESDSDAWSQIAPLLDEALNCLGTKEHDAVVLRFLDGKELKHVGAAMGTTEDGARMRVNRGLEKLREFFTKKGVTLSATAIAGAVAANSVQAAPAGLAASITGAALSGTTITTAAVIAATKTIAMTTLQKTVITTAIVVAVGTGIYHARQASNLRTQVQALRETQAQQVQQLQSERDNATQQLAVLRDDNERLNRNSAELLTLRAEVGRLRSALTTSQKGMDTEKALASWLKRVKEFKGLQTRMPDKIIPELRLLTEEDWLDLAKEPLGHSASEVNLNDDAVARLVFSSIRDKAKDKMERVLSRALEGYADANNGQLPTDTLQLQPYLMNTHFLGPARAIQIPEGSIDSTILQRYEVLQTGKLADMPQDAAIISEKAPVDTQYDSQLQVGRFWWGLASGTNAYANKSLYPSDNPPTK
jgi:RNA polymerase sigma factor (sigma-70 family)